HTLGRTNAGSRETWGPRPFCRGIAFQGDASPQWHRRLACEPAGDLSSDLHGSPLPLSSRSPRVRPTGRASRIALKGDATVTAPPQPPAPLPHAPAPSPCPTA